MTEIFVYLHNGKDACADSTCEHCAFISGAFGMGRDSETHAIDAISDAGL